MSATLARRVREVVTPEGVPVPFELASAGDRMAAFIVDFVVLVIMLLIMGFVAMFAMLDGGASWAGAFFALILFSLRSVYFIFFELRWQGRTPGKRLVGIRVMDAHGGPLRGDAIFVRNLTRELELWVALSVLFNPQALVPDAPGWAAFLSMVWAALFLFLPLFNKTNSRMGDFFAGTIVVRTPKSRLLGDLGGREVQRAEKQRAQYAFTKKQVEVYGIYELQVLEDLLRRPSGQARDDALRAVFKRVRRKIRWKGDDVDNPERFLREYYAALRAHLEQKMLLGKRKKDKFS